MPKNQKDEVRKSINQFEKLFAYKPKDSEIIPESERVGYMDINKYMMIVPKNYYYKSILTQDFDVEEQKVPDLKCNDQGGSNYSVEFLNLILPLLKNTAGEKVYIETGKDFPIILETEEVKIIFAPRID